MRDSGSFEVTSDIREYYLKRLSFLREIDISRFFLIRSIFLRIERIEESEVWLRIRAIKFDSGFESFEKSFFSRSENKLIRDKRDRFVNIVSIESSRSNDTVNMRVPIKFSTEGVNNRENTRSGVVFRGKKETNGVRSNFGKKCKSRTMLFKKRTEFFWDSKGEMKIMKIRRSSMKETVHSKVRLRSSARITEARFAGKRYMFDVGTIITFERSESRRRLTTLKDFVD